MGRVGMGVGRGGMGMGDGARWLEESATLRGRLVGAGGRHRRPPLYVGGLSSRPLDTH